MKLLWCWRCKMDVPMLDDEEFEEAKRLYKLGFKDTNSDRFKQLLDYYNLITGFNER